MSTGSKASPRRGASASARRRARQAALTGLYQWLISHEDPAVIQVNVEEQDVHAGCDRPHFEALLHGCVGQAANLDAALARHVDRPTADLSPVEHAALMIGAYELSNCIEIPYRVVINEAVELTKAFGGTDGHKYVNGVLDKTAADLRPLEVQAARADRS